MDLKDFHDTVRFFCNKEQGGWFAPEEIDNLTDRAQMWFYTDLFDEYAKNQKVQDALSPFSVKIDFASAPTGLITLPNDYQHLLSLTTKYYDATAKRNRYKPIKILTEDEIGERLGSQILEPTFQDPVGIEIKPGQIQLYPETVIYGTSYYMCRPAKPVFKYTQTGRSIVYDQAGSTQMEWSETAINKILIKTIQMAGVNISDQMIVQYTELKNQQDI
jgi:hypothetical protein